MIDARGLFAQRGFLGLWLTGTLISIVRWLDMLAVGIYVFDLTGSPSQVAVVAVLRMLPLAVCGMLAGAVTERFHRIVLIRIGLVAMLLTSSVLAALAWAEVVEVWHLALGALLNGLYWVMDMPARRTLIAEIAGPPRVATAMTLESVTNNGTRMVGPIAGGFLLEVLGLAGTFALGAALYALALTTLPRQVDGTVAPAATGGGLIASIRDGLGVLRGNRALTGVLAVTLVFNLWGFPFVTMIPVIGKDVLGLSAFPVGLLSAAEGAGALVGALLLAVVARPRNYRTLYVAGVLLYLTMALGFGRATWAPLSAVLLLAAGLGGAAFAAMQSTLVLLCSAPESRGRMMGLLTVCIGAAPLGFLHIGLMADLLGTSTAISVVAIEGMIALVVTLLLWPELEHPQALSG